MTQTKATEAWPELPWTEWGPTVSTVHRWIQIVGRIRMALTPRQRHWGHIALYVTARGLTTSPIPHAGGPFEIAFDFTGHRLEVRRDGETAFALPLEPMSVAAFHARLMAGLRAMAIEVAISTAPAEQADGIPFERDEEHASYDAGQARLMWRGMVDADRVLAAFRRELAGDVTPVQLLWGSLDLAVSHYAGEPAVEQTVGWWPASEAPGPAFYAYTKPEPAGFRSAAVEPDGASFSERYGEFIVANDDLRRAVEPDAAALAFARTTLRAGSGTA